MEWVFQSLKMWATRWLHKRSCLHLSHSWLSAKIWQTNVLLPVSTAIAVLQYMQLNLVRESLLNPAMLHSHYSACFYMLLHVDCCWVGGALQHSPKYEHVASGFSTVCQSSQQLRWRREIRQNLPSLWAIFRSILYIYRYSATSITGVSAVLGAKLWLCNNMPDTRPHEFFLLF